MKLDIDLTIKYDPEREKSFGEISAKLDKIASVIQLIQTFEGKTMSALSDLQAAVAKNTTVGESAVTLLRGLKAKIDAAGTDAAALKALSADLGAKTEALAAAIVENTPVAEEPEPQAQQGQQAGQQQQPPEAA